jgi:subtilisin-like proprotein convertase family protein
MSHRNESRREIVTAAWIAVAVSMVLAAGATAKQAPTAGQPVLASAGLQPADIEERGSVLNAGDTQISKGLQSDVVRRYWRRTATDPARKASAAPAVIARQFLLENAVQFGLDPARLASDLVLDTEKTSPSGTHYRYQQVVGGVPVYRGEVVVKVSNGGEVSSVHNNVRLGLELDVTPGLDQAAAIAIGVGAVSPTGKALGDFTAELRVVEFESGARLAYLVSVPVEAPMGDWLVFVDAKSGAVLAVEDRMVYASASGRVFDPDPKTKMNNTTYIDSNDADSAVPFPASYDTRTLQDVTLASGVYSLSGPYARILEFESPTSTPVTTTDPVNGFLFQRNAQGFEDIMCYWHIDENQRYIQSLGFTNVNNRVQEIDSHGLSGADNSHYVISTQRLAFGEGGVDDAEDADVVLHEYGHAIQHNVVPGWGGGHEGAMGEGFGDYWAGSYSYAINPTFQPSFMFTWDGHNQFWAGRLLVDSLKHYPENCCDGVHASGTLWCSGMTDCMRRVGRSVMDRLVLDHHFALGTTATKADAANQVIQSDLDLYGGAHLPTIIPVLDFWGFVDAASFVPIVTHTPHGDTGDIMGPYTIVATITSATALVPGSVLLRWGIGDTANSTPMTPTGNPNEYSADIPGPLSGVEVHYYVTAQNAAGTTTNPAGAPGNYHLFHIGPNDASIAGRVRLAGQTQHDGVLLTLQPGGATTMSDMAGDYSFSNLYAGNYTVNATKANFAPASRNVTVFASTPAAGQDLVLYPVASANVCSAAPQAIVEGPFGIANNVNVTASWAVVEARVQVNITHPNIGDLIVEVVHNSETVRLHNLTGGTTDNIIGTYPTTLSVSGPGSLSGYIGDPANGQWRLRIVDATSPNTGTLQQWCILLTGPADTTVDSGEEPGIGGFLRSEPNPMPVGGQANVQFALPRDGDVALDLYDVAGRRVRHLFAGSVAAGRHALVWDGHDDAGRSVAAGVYVYRLTTPEGAHVRKLVVTR